MILHSSVIAILHPDCFSHTGKVYYYHVITRKTQWEPPTEQDVEGTITMDLGTPEPESDSEHGKVREQQMFARNMTET